MAINALIARKGKVVARIRTIKPEFFTSEDIVELDPIGRLLYIALWCEADREGRLSWKPKTFKMRYFPADNIDINKVSEELIKRGLVVLYGDNLAFIPKFLCHQHINPRESGSNLPVPDVYMRVSDACSTREERDSDVQVGREGKEVKECKTRRVATSKSETLIPDDFAISDNVRTWADEHGHDQLEKHLANFIDSCKAKGYKYRDWDAAFRNAISKNWAKLAVTKKSEGDPNEIVTLGNGQQMTRQMYDFMQRVGA